MVKIQFDLPKHLDKELQKLMIEIEVNDKRKAVLQLLEFCLNGEGANLITTMEYKFE